ncbi:MAG: ribosome silencing factor [Bdellovibrionales bacterium GWA2_49_15]|nr:MAG: ribosome silencing factor [Bdellovibrionales bacterium GWA2_49_15]
MATVWILANFKGSDLKILDVGKHSSMADYFVIASAGNPTQAGAMADTVCQMMKKNNIAIKSLEGSSGSEWTLIDLGDVIVHIFQETARNIYDLEGLYTTSNLVKIPENYYFQGQEKQPKGPGTSSDDENYF